MLMDAVVEKGQVRFLHPVKFLHDYFPIKIDVPDQEVLVETTTSCLGIEAQSMPSEYLNFMALQEAVFGKQYQYAPEKTDKEVMQEHWTEKHA